MRVVAYERVSTRDQHFASQSGRIESFCAARGFTLAGRFEDVMSGGDASRPALQELERLVRTPHERDWEAVLVYRLDRLGRNARHLAELVGETLPRYGVQFISCSEAIDTTTPMGRCQLQIFAAFAEYERAQIRERTLAGLEAAAKEGRYPGRPPSIVVADLRRMIEMKEAGMRLTEIYERFPRYKPGTIRRNLWERRTKEQTWKR